MTRDPHSTGLETHGVQSESSSSFQGSSTPNYHQPPSLVDGIREALKNVQDPEIHLDIVTLNLIYQIKEEHGHANILMTFTTPLCPFGPALVEEVKRVCLSVAGVTSCEVTVTFTPLWEPTPEVRMMMGV